MKIYHVSNVSSDNNSPPSWDIIKLSLPNDMRLDGKYLYGLPVAMFSSTLWNGVLPIYSTYPRNTPSKNHNGKRHYRFTTNMGIDHYLFYKMCESTTFSDVVQVHFICIPKENPCEIEIIVSEELNSIPGIKLIGKDDLHEYFPNGKGNNYARQDKKKRFWVNVCLLTPVCTFSGVWDTVEQRSVACKYFTPSQMLDHLRIKMDGNWSLPYNTIFAAKMSLLRSYYSTNSVVEELTTAFSSITLIGGNEEGGTFYGDSKSYISYMRTIYIVYTM